MAKIREQGAAIEVLEASQKKLREQLATAVHERDAAVTKAQRINLELTSARCLVNGLLILNF